ncbi:MAG: choice-of-anchor Q domain-containing protein [Pirellulales bacterium]
MTQRQRRSWGLGFRGQTTASAWHGKHTKRLQSPHHLRTLGSEQLESRRLLTITVDTLVDEADGSINDGDVSLRDAIALAPIGETIDFSVTGKILLELGELVIDKSLMILGPGAEKLTIDASGNDPTPESVREGYFDLAHPNAGDGSRIFNVDDGSPNYTSNVVITGLSLTGGDVDGNGGAILSQENIVIADALIYRNVAAPSSGYPLGGGAIFANNDGGHVTITGSVISTNWTTGEGGGIYAQTTGFGSDVTTSILNSTVTGNRAAGDGGGILANTRGSRLVTTLNSITVSNNYSRGDGGGINTSTHGSLSHTTIDEATIAGNSANERGGGISIFTNDAGETKVNDSTISRNSHGGVSTSTLWDDKTTITIAGSLITQNSNDSGGGGIESFGPLTVSHSTVSGNLALGPTADGGGIDAGGNLLVEYSEITGNATSGRGGGIRATQGITLTHSTVSTNSARYGGGIEIANALMGVTLISHSTFSANSADVSGGAINGFAFGGVTEIESTTISGNSAGKDGGGIAGSIRSSEILPGALSIRHSTIVDNVANANEAYGGLGGGILISGNAPPLVSHTIVAQNHLANGAPNDAVGTVDAGSSYNLIGSDAGLVGVSDGVSGNQIGTVAAPLDPMLGALVDNGGPTKTHAPLPSSPAIDAGDPLFTPPPYTDQRGYYRVVDGDGDASALIDIGAVEFDSMPVLVGDGNLDGVVDGLDYLVWAAHFDDAPALTPPGSPLNGDYNNDGVVDGLDYNAWTGNFGASRLSPDVDRSAASDALFARGDADDLLPMYGAKPSSAAFVIGATEDTRAAEHAVDAVFTLQLTKKNADRGNRH